MSQARIAAKGKRRHSERGLDTLDLATLESRLDASEEGLSGAEAARRLVRYGPNELPEARRGVLPRVLSYFWGPIPRMIQVAAVLSAAVGRWPDFGIIMALLATNAGVGFWEEYQATNAIAALRGQLSLEARVRRDGAWRTIPARDLVPGDVIRVRLGDIVPADARLLDGEPLDVDQSLRSLREPLHAPCSCRRDAVWRATSGRRRLRL